MSVFSLLYQSYTIRALIKYKINHFGYTNEFDYYLSSYRTKGWGTWGVIEKEIPMNESVKLIKELQTKLSEQNIRFFLFDFNNSGSEIAKANKLPFIPLKIEFEPDDFIYKDGHLNEKGCTKVAETLCSRLIKYNLIPEKYHHPD